jgi:hypothetical protein
MLSDNELEMDSTLNLFRGGLTEARSFEALQVLKPVSVRIVQIDLLNPQLIEVFLENVLGQYAIVSRKAIDLFCELVRILRDSSLSQLMANVRCFLGEIFVSGFLSSHLRDCDYFLWLNSDLLVYKDLSDIWRIGWEHHRQRMFGAHLNHPVNDLNCLAIRKTHETDEVKDGICRISGGVVLWNIRTIIKDCR